MEALKNKMGQPKKKYETTTEKSVWRPKSKMGQRKKYETTPQKRTYGSLEVKWDNRKKYITTPQKRTYGRRKHTTRTECKTKLAPEGTELRV